MAQGFDSYKNGLLFGAVFGFLVYYIALLPSSFLSFLSGWFGLVTWLQAQSWFSFASSFSATTIGYAIAVLVGAGIGIYIDKQ